jgi:hypothetical protein
VQPLYLRLLVSEMAQHGLEAENFALPALLAGLVQQTVRVFRNQHQARELNGVHSEHRAADTCMLVGTIRLVRSEAVAERHLPATEMLLKLDPFRRSRLAILLRRPRCPPARDVGLNMADNLVVVHSHVPLGGVDVQVTQQFGRNMHGKAAVDGVGGEDPAQVVRSEDKQLAVYIPEHGISSRAIKQADENLTTP